MWPCASAGVVQVNNFSGYAGLGSSGASKNLDLRGVLKFDIIIISTGDTMELFEQAFFYGDYTMLPSTQELLEAEEKLS